MPGPVPADAAQAGVSLLELSWLLGVHHNTAWLVKQKLMQAMLERDAGRRLRGTVQLDDACLGGAHPGGKRGRGSENKVPLVAALQVGADGHPALLHLTVVPGFRRAALATWARAHLKPGTKVHSDGLACFGGVVEAGCAHEVHVTGGGRAGCETPALSWVNTVLGHVKRSLDAT